MLVFFLFLTTIKACPFDQLDMNKISFRTIDEYRQKERPFVLHNAMEEWNIIQKSSNHFIERYKFMKVKFDERDKIAYHGAANKTINISDVFNINGLSFTFFKDMKNMNTVEDMRLLNNYFPKLAFSEHLPKRFQRHKVLSLAKNKGGIDFHNHGDSYLALLEGEKEWQIFPHDFEAFDEYSSFNTIEYVDSVGFRPLICKQKAGTILYLPKGFDHRTVNINNNFAVAWQETYPTHTPNNRP